MRNAIAVRLIFLFLSLQTSACTPRRDPWPDESGHVRFDRYYDHRPNSAFKPSYSNLD
jgi:hypothetical protein